MLGKNQLMTFCSSFLILYQRKRFGISCNLTICTKFPTIHVHGETRKKETPKNIKLSFDEFDQGKYEGTKNLLFQEIFSTQESNPIFGDKQ